MRRGVPPDPLLKFRAGVRILNDVLDGDALLVRDRSGAKLEPGKLPVAGGNDRELQRGALVAQTLEAEKDFPRFARGVSEPEHFLPMRAVFGGVRLANNFMIEVNRLVLRGIKGRHGQFP
jgi:hypothetical protein